ncbi:MATE family efflux transporter [Paraburkholderia terrae]|uniref:MATE family efflux transporter n=1 Tax=Paraburkholderia terrae TaxID=311230 RepID=UPI002852971A|nr:MATE family efflux transporter [Paraburkholderia terrae]
MTNSLRALALFRLSLPLAAMEIPVVATVAIDTVLLGRLGAPAVAAGGLGAAVFLFVASICVSVISSVGHEAAFRSGRRDRRGMLGVLMGGVALSCLLGCGAAVATAVVAPFLRVLGQDSVVAQHAAWYLYGVAPGFPFLLLAVCFRGMLAVQPGTARLVAVAALSVGVKALLALAGWIWLSTADVSLPSRLLMCGVTTSATFCVMATSAWCAWRRSNLQNRVDPTSQETATGAHRIIRRGLTIGLTTALQTGFFTVVAILCGRCGPADLAAHQVANQCTLLPLMFAFGMSQAAATLTSQAAGAGSPLGARRTSWHAVGLGVVAMLMVAGVLVISGRAAIGAILPAGTPGREHVAEIAWQLILIGAWCQLADGAQNIAMGALRGLSQGSITVRAAVIAYWLIGIPLASLLGLKCGLGATGVWMGVGVGLHVSAALLLYYLYRATYLPSDRVAT